LVTHEPVNNLNCSFRRPLLMLYLCMPHQVI
jgi:hypothetical protein